VRKHARLVTLVFVVSMSACSQPDVEVTEQEWGSKWPFTVSSGRLECKGQAVIFHANGQSYAVNGVAKQRGYASIDSIWREDPEMKQALGGKADVGPKVSVGPIIERGLSLCK